MVWMVLLVLMDLPAPWMKVLQALMAPAVQQAQPVLADHAVGPTAAHVLALLHPTDHAVDPPSAYALGPDLGQDRILVQEDHTLVQDLGHDHILVQEDHTLDQDLGHGHILVQGHALYHVPDLVHDQCPGLSHVLDRGQDHEARAQEVDHVHSLVLVLGVCPAPEAGVRVVRPKTGMTVTKNQTWEN